MPWKECPVLDERLRFVARYEDCGGGPFSAALEKCRFAKARPEADFRYFSKRTAAFSVGNSRETTTDHGR